MQGRPNSTTSPAPVRHFERGVVTVVGQGDCLVSGGVDATFSTVLGSCISACIRDKVALVGGMNHFLLARPPGTAAERYGASARYGAFAMEQLINMMLSRGTGKKANLEFKIFGGGVISGALADVGASNVAFVREFLAAEGYQNVREDVGGSLARRVMFKPVSGRAVVRRLDAAAGASVAREEVSVARRPVARPDDIEWF